MNFKTVRPHLQIVARNMVAPRDAYEYVCNQVRHPYEVAVVSAGLLIGEVLSRTVAPEMVVHANDSLGKQAAMALPSALPTPEMTGNGPVVDTAVQIGLVGAGLEAARRTTSRKELAALALGAQALACAADAGVERTGALTPVERAQEDIGFSSIYVAWFTKFLLDRRAQAQTAREKLRYTGALVAGAGLIVATAFADSKGWKLDLTAHGSGAVAGGIAHGFGQARKEVRQARVSAANPSIG